MIRLDLDAIRARCDAATKGPWRVSTLTFPNGNTVVESITGASEPQWSDYGDGNGEWSTDRLTLVETDAGHYGPTMPDAEFIAFARTDIPALLAYIEELESRVTYTVGETEWAHRVAVAEQKAEEAQAQAERLRGALPPRSPDGRGLTRYGLHWDGPSELVAVPLTGGYWTPWHLASAAYRRGADAMREACADACWSVPPDAHPSDCAFAVNALPTPEEP